jgi:hypothetical protein
MVRGGFGRLAVCFVAVAFAVAGVVPPADARGGHGGGHGGAHGGRGGGGHGGGSGRDGFRGVITHGGGVQHFVFRHHVFFLGFGADLYYPFAYYYPFYYYDDPYCAYNDPYCYDDPYDYSPRYDPYDDEPSAPVVPDRSEGIPPPQAPLQTGSTPPPQPLFCWDVGSLRWQPCPTQRGAPPSPSTASRSSGAPGLN